ncbi:MAG: DUF4123 domain-containing protein [Planctomycetes bacterium]|nr:DUF4123 domain-containing protein [Planctomycetota bacterium]
MPTQPALVAIDGPSAGKRWPFEVGKNVTIGRVDQATIIVRDDPLLSNLHFALEWEGPTCRVRDLNSKFGITLNDVKVDAAVVRDGDRIKAGRSEFLMKLATDQADAGAPAQPARLSQALAEPSMPDVPAEVKSAAVLEFLRLQQAPLFALLDGARDIAIYLQLMACKEQYQSLYEGPQGEALAPHGPYLVYLPKDSPFLAMLMRDGWGNSWGVYLTSPAPFAEVRRHLRRFLEVQLPTGKVVLFRFYDPRVLRNFVPTCSDADAMHFLGPIDRFIIEADDAGRPLVISRETKSVSVREIKLPRA